MRPKSLYISTYERMRYLILSGEWTSGSQLPAERRLAEQWNISRNTIVTAYAALETEGFIRSKMGSGRFVNPLAAAERDASANWKMQLSQAHAGVSPFAMTKMFAQASAEATRINFAFGEGGRHILAATGFTDGFDMAQILAQSSADYLVPILGNADLRKWISDRSDHGFSTSPEHMMITSGSQEALYLTAGLLAKPGDAVAVEMPTFFGALQVFHALGLEIVPIPMDGQGMRVEVLEGLLTRTSPRFIYTNPTFQNPTGTVLPMERRERLLRLAERFDVPIVEDDAYRDLYFQTEPPTSLKALDRSGNVIYINTFSKTLFPGLRLGWITANQPFLRSLMRRKELSFTTNTFAQHVLLAYLRKGTFQQHLERARSLYRDQAVAMEHHLLGLSSLGVTYTKPQGGFYMWIGLPSCVNPLQLAQEAMKQGVLFLTGDTFLTRSVQQSYIRLSYSGESVDTIHVGMNIIVSMLRSLT